MNIAYFADLGCNHSLNWIKNFSESNDVIIICSEGAKILEEFNEIKVMKIYPIIPSAFPLNNPIKLFRTIKRIKKILKQHNIEVLHSMYAVPNTFWASLAGSNIKHIVTTRGSDVLVDYDQKLKNPQSIKKIITFFLLRKLFEYSIRKASYITSTSLKQQTVLRKLIKDENKLKLIRTGVVVEDFTPQVKGKNGEDVYIFSPRALRELYNIDMIIEAFAASIDRFPSKNLKLLQPVYGSNDSYFNYINDLVKNLGVKENVEFLPYLSLEDLNHYYEISDMVVMIPSSDGTPVTGIEAMLKKVPLIIGPLEYDEDIFNEGTVWKISAFDKRILADMLEKVIKDNGQDKTDIIENAYANVLEKANRNKEIEKVYQLYIE